MRIEPIQMIDLINELWFLPRNLVSDGFDQALYRLAAEVPMTVHEYPNGETCWTWKIPEKWSCQEAILETLDGQRLIDASLHPLHVVAYSLPYEGTVSRAELLQHLHTHRRLPEAIPFVFKYYERDWGLCCSQELRDSLHDETYRVKIQTTFEPGTLKVGEVIIPGETDECFVLVAHLCHPAMVNDDLSGVVVGLDVARTLLDGPTPSLHGALAHPAGDHRLGGVPQPPRTPDPEDGWWPVPGNAGQRFGACTTGLLPA